MCKDNEYGCHATATRGVVWTGRVTDIGLEEPTDEPVTRTPTTDEGIEAWGIKFLQISSTSSTVGRQLQKLPRLLTSSGRRSQQPPNRLPRPRKIVQGAQHSQMKAPQKPLKPTRRALRTLSRVGLLLVLLLVVLRQLVYWAWGHFCSTGSGSVRSELQTHRRLCQAQSVHRTINMDRPVFIRRESPCLPRCGPGQTKGLTKHGNYHDYCDVRLFLS